MLCEICRKQLASVTRMVDRGFGDQKMAVCFECAKQIDDKTAVSKYSEFFWGASESKKVETKIERCPTCGYSIEDIKRTSYVGCRDCYNVFRREIALITTRIHGKNVHVGKVPLSEVGRQDNMASTSASLTMKRAIEYGDIDLAKIARKHFPGSKGDF